MTRLQQCKFLHISRKKMGKGSIMYSAYTNPLCFMQSPILRNRRKSTLNISCGFYSQLKKARVKTVLCQIENVFINFPNFPTDVLSILTVLTFSYLSIAKVKPTKRIQLYIKIVPPLDSLLLKHRSISSMMTLKNPVVWKRRERAINKLSSRSIEQIWAWWLLHTT